ncbi:MAG: NADH-quinone oxidoreductase subunit J [Candidatus Marinimicrobia bacterium]|jgi:NADH-quinone oxidoreductase subunit J|nr:NADH-quinone oxidoreductase subunit J [Candidatus Neomarinimicrobiota bacterium]MBT4308371.1 NADH-quinone oxidoreductase subunit J [Candidatus Neomarinimicrobiota bacterium]MBT4452968.1 NADH-quinone oxidoreductase subunit J [Candidatus Neomarinimicrobiota bacterium]MBT5386685.1 NADH-quinone oxidoreductase subunit J [Candidatus Neomarinimicrobiota bacterium]MBT5776510.1 NADH-quinone oxidoreductase subunit J [Candidatus Neomarinimicrobiota bacterium]
MADFTFWIVVGLTLGSAFMVVQSKNLLYSAYALLFSFIGVTGLYVFLWADFIAVVQVVVYVGGILILIIFGIMLTNKITSVNISHTSVQKGIGTLAVLGIATLLAYMVFSTPWIELANVEQEETTASIGRLLMMDYLLPFEAASLLLLGALIGATTLSRKED